MIPRIGCTSRRRPLCVLVSIGICLVGVYVGMVRCEVIDTASTISERDGMEVKNGRKFSRRILLTGLNVNESNEERNARGGTKEASETNSRIRNHSRTREEESNMAVDDGHCSVSDTFPHLGTAPPANYSIKSSWLPPGGWRFEEYVDGGSPYEITAKLRSESDELARARRPHIKKAMQFVWRGYSEHAFGMDELRPISAGGKDNWGGLGVTLVDSLDTLWLMDMKEEFWEARDWVRDHLTHNKNQLVSVFETTIRSLGGLLSAYDWSGDPSFLDQSLDLAKRLMRAFDQSPTGIPWGEINLLNGNGQHISWTNGNAILAEFGTLQVEFRYLDQVVRTPETAAYRMRVERLFKILNQMSPPEGLFPFYIGHHGQNHKTRGGGDPVHTIPKFSNNIVTFGAMADSFYEYMLKIWIQGGKTEAMYREMYDRSIQGLHDKLLKRSSPSGLTYIAEKRGESMDHKMDHLACFMGGQLALGAYTDPLGLESKRAQRDLRTAKALTYTCYQMYARMQTGTSADHVRFVAGVDFRPGTGYGTQYLLRPETVESFYILNALTGDPIYREWGWEIFQAIEKYCRTKIGYGALRDVQNPEQAPLDQMESFFLAETLKYLYLLMDPENEVDLLKKHVFNTEAHPLRVFPVLEAETKPL